MRIPTIVFGLLFTSMFITTTQCQNTSVPFNVTAIAARNNSSVLQCWQLTHSPLTSTSTPGTAGALDILLSDASNVSYTVIPARFDGGVHNAPAHLWVVFLSGLAHVSLPNATAEAWITGGKYGVLFAADTRDVSASGHRTVYPSDDVTTVLQIPVGKEGIPEHRVLYEGGCRWGELVGL